MRPLSATEAFTPALERTKSLLRPFSLKLWLKLGLVAFAAEMGAQFVFPPIGNAGAPASSQSSGIGAVAGGLSEMWIMAILGFGLIVFLVGLVVLYVGSRTQFVLMDLVATHTTLVRLPWHRHASKTWRWIGLKVATFFAIFVLLGVVLAGPLIVVFRNISRNVPQPGAAFFGSFFLIFTMIILAVIALVTVVWTLRDFVLPFIVFEDAMLAVAIRSAVELIRREPLSILFYFLMKLAFGFVAAIAAEFAILISMLIVAIPAGGIGAIVWLALRHAGAFGTAIMYATFGMLGIVFVAALFTAVICMGGATLVFYQAYALYFIGGRIPSVGALLEPPPPPFAAPPFVPMVPTPL